MCRVPMRIGVVGTGKMGSDLVATLLEHAFGLVWLTRSRARREEVERWVAKKLARLDRAQGLSPEALGVRQEAVTVTTSEAELESMDLLIECIAEDLSAKQALLARLREVLPPACIVASNTSSIPLRRVFDPWEDRSRCAGLHFFYPIAFKKFVELNVLPETTGDVTSALEGFVSGIGRVPLLLAEGHHFLLNRIFTLYLAESFRFFQEGLFTPGELDRLVEERLFPVGPFRLMDAVGIEVMAESARNYATARGEAEFCRPWLEALERLAEAGFLGDKAGGGFGGEGATALRLAKPARDLKPQEAERAVERLRVLFLKAVLRELEHGSAQPEQLDEAVKDYTGCARGPLEQLRGLGTGWLAERLDYYHRTTGWEVYAPVPSGQSFER